jgi:hypothetical protein
MQQQATPTASHRSSATPLRNNIYVEHVCLCIQLLFFKFNYISQVDAATSPVLQRNSLHTTPNRNQISSDNVCDTTSNSIDSTPPNVNAAHGMCVCVDITHTNIYFPVAATSSMDDTWERMSVCSEISLACLQDRIVQMQETHFSTTEELQVLLLLYSIYLFLHFSRLHWPS